MAACSSKLAIATSTSTSFTSDELLVISTVIANANLSDITNIILRIAKYSNRIRDMIVKKYGLALPISAAHVYDVRTINGTPVILCVGTTNDSLGFAFFVIGNLVDVFIPTLGAGFFTLKGKLTSIASLWTTPSYNIHKMCLYEFTGYFQQAYGLTHPQITRIYNYIDARQMMSGMDGDDDTTSTSIDVSSLYDYILDHILSLYGINTENMWTAIERAYSF